MNDLFSFGGVGWVYQSGFVANERTCTALTRDAFEGKMLLKERFVCTHPHTLSLFRVFFLSKLMVNFTVTLFKLRPNYFKMTSDF